jgi:hypothetical protein
MTKVSISLSEDKEQGCEGSEYVVVDKVNKEELQVDKVVYRSHFVVQRSQGLVKGITLAASLVVFLEHVSGSVLIIQNDY